MADARRIISGRTAQLIAASLAAAIAYAPGRASAQTAPDTGFNGERLRIALDSNGLIDAEWAAVPEHLNYELGIWFDYEHNPLLLNSTADGHHYGALLKGRFDGSVYGSVGLFGFAEMGLEIPFVLSQTRDSDIPGGTAQSLPSLKSAGLSDIRFVPKIQLLSTAKAGLDFAVVGSFTLPTGGGSDYLGDKGATFNPELALSRAFLGTGIRTAFNVGVNLRRDEQYLDEEIRNELEGRLAVGYRFDDGMPSWQLPLEVDTSLSGWTSLTHPFKYDNQKAMEWRFDVTYRINEMVSIFGGPGWGFGDGAPTPQWRAFLGARFELGKPPPAPAPAPARVQAVVVAPPPAPAPEPTPAAPPPVAVAPPAAEPAPAPAAPVEVKVEVKTDKPAVVESKTEVTPPVIAGPKLNDGAIELGGDTVQFEANRDVISARSFALLDAVAQIVKDHAEVGSFRVEGYTDNSGNAANNLALSKRRAASVVRYLIGKGVAPERLLSEGFGEARPIADNKTEAGRAANRRVEFHAVKPDAAK